MSATLLGSLLQTLFLLGFSPALNGLIKSMKARLQTRKGPPILQGYRDIAKWLRKQSIYSEYASWISRAAPLVSFAAILCAGLLVSMLVREVPLNEGGDLIVVVGLFSLARVATALAGLDAGGAFGGMGSSREMAIAALAEPVLLLAAFIPAIQVGSTSLPQMTTASGMNAAGLVLGFVALFVVVIAETGRIPVDNPDTHLELTMVHEGMIMESAGPGLALYHWGAMVKQLILLSLLFDLFLPWGLAGIGDGVAAVSRSVACYLLKLVLCTSALALTETGMAKLRIFRVPDLLGTAFALALLGLAAEAALHA